MNTDLNIGMVDAYMIPTDAIESVDIKSSSVGDVCWTGMVSWVGPLASLHNILSQRKSEFLKN